MRRDLATQPWLISVAIRKVFSALTAEGGEARVVGGAPRNALMGEPVDDIDIATNVPPQDSLRLAAEHGLKTVATGLEHGTITVISDGQPFEVTTLRQDIETDGRRAVVSFTDDWQADASRRDFTINALYVDPDGRLHDPTGHALADCEARRIRFIGDPEARIREDYLRILRFFRFYARYGDGPPDALGLNAARETREGVRKLSAERVGREIRKTLSARRATRALEAMREIGVLEIVLDGPSWVEDLSRLLRLSPGAIPTWELKLAALACRSVDDVSRLTKRLRLSNAESARLASLLSASAENWIGVGAIAPRLALYRYGRQTATQGALLAWTRDAAPATDPHWTSVISELSSMEVPVFPVAGRDVLATGRAPGPQVGELLRAMETVWIDTGFTLSRAELLATLEDH